LNVTKDRVDHGGQRLGAVDLDRVSRYVLSGLDSRSVGEGDDGDPSACAAADRYARNSGGSRGSGASGKPDRDRFVLIAKWTPLVPGGYPGPTGRSP
jgi:hypothetical protein